MSDPTKSGADGAAPARRTPLRFELAWAGSVGIWCLLVAVVGLWLFLERIRHL